MKEFKGTKDEWYIKNTHVHCDTGTIVLSGSIRKVDETRNEGESWKSMWKRTNPVREELRLEAAANMKLIVASKDLLEALQKIVDAQVCSGEFWDGIRSAKEAINKALI